MYKKIGSIIVTYNPNDNLLNLVKKIKKTSMELIIIDNSLKKNNIILELEKQKIKIIHFPQNIGISRGIREGLELFSGKIKYFFTFDQDSDICEKYFSFFMNEIKEEISILCPKIIDLNLQRETKNLRKINNTNICIQSGMLINKEKYNLTTGFKDDLFMYYVDDDICFKMSKVGFMKQIDKAILFHKDGNMIEKKLLEKKIVYNERSDIAIYYRARNSIYMIKNYSFIYFKDLVYDLVLNLIFSKQKKFFLKTYLNGLKKGIVDFL